jgi:hypothetical protein
VSLPLNPATTTSNTARVQRAAAPLPSKHRNASGSEKTPSSCATTTSSVEDKIDKLLLKDPSKTDFALPRPSASYYYDKIPAHHLPLGTAHGTSTLAEAGDAVLNGTSELKAKHAARNYH